MNLDIRLPMGMMFALLGAIIMVFGLVSDPALYECSLGINVNLWWGMALVVFGAAMLLLAKRAASVKPSTPTATDQTT